MPQGLPWGFSLFRDKDAGRVRQRPHRCFYGAFFQGSSSHDWFGGGAGLTARLALLPYQQTEGPLSWFSCRQ